MDSLVTAAARALQRGDPLGALKQIALRNDPAALALRGIAMAQLGDFQKAKDLLRRAARSFGPRERLERARCATAEAEVALASRDLSWPTRALEAARQTFAARGDHDNQIHAALLQIRRSLILGRIEEAEHAFDELDLRAARPGLIARGELVVFELALRRGQAAPAHAALLRAKAAATRTGITALVVEVERAEEMFTLPVARLAALGGVRAVTLPEVEVLLATDDLIVDACRRSVRKGRFEVRLARRPVLFSLLRELASAWPKDAARETLAKQAFGARRLDESHRARLRVEIGRLRKELGEVGVIRTTPAGFLLEVLRGNVLILEPPLEGPGATVLAMMADGEAWSASALALALGSSPRTTQRTLGTLAAEGKVRALGKGRARRWVAAPLSGFATTLLLPSPPHSRFT